MRREGTRALGILEAMKSEAQSAFDELTASLADPMSSPDNRARAERMLAVAAAEVLAATSPHEAADDAEHALRAWAAAPSDHEAVWAFVHCADVLHRAGRSDRAYSVAREALSLSSQTLDVYDPLVRRALETCGHALAALGRIDEAERMFEALRNISNFDTAEARAATSLRIARGLKDADPGVAHTFAADAASVFGRELGPAAPATLEAEVLAAECMSRSGNLDAAVDRLRRCIVAAQEQGRAAYPLEALALLLSEAGRGEQAIAAIRDAVEDRALDQEASLAGALTFHNAALIVSRHAIARGSGLASALAAYATALDAYAAAGASADLVSRAGLEAADVAAEGSMAAAATIRSVVLSSGCGRTIAGAIRNAQVGSPTTPSASKPRAL